MSISPTFCPRILARKALQMRRKQLNLQRRRKAKRKDEGCEFCPCHLYYCITYFQNPPYTHKEKRKAEEKLRAQQIKEATERAASIESVKDREIRLLTEKIAPHKHRIHEVRVGAAQALIEGAEEISATQIFK